MRVKKKNSMSHNLVPKISYTALELYVQVKIRKSKNQKVTKTDNRMLRYTYSHLEDLFSLSFGMFISGTDCFRFLPKLNVRLLTGE